MQTACIRSSVVAAVQCMEDNEYINCALGSSLTITGKVECDASLMNVNTSKYTSMTALSIVKNPIKAVDKLYLMSNASVPILSHGRLHPMLKYNVFLLYSTIALK